MPHVPGKHPIIESIVTRRLHLNNRGTERRRHEDLVRQTIPMDAEQYLRMSKALAECGTVCIPEFGDLLTVLLATSASCSFNVSFSITGIRTVQTPSISSSLSAATSSSW
jgi:hypothetical protein